MSTRNTISALFSVLACSALAAQGPSQEELQERRDKKLASDFLLEAPWTTDYDDARATAKESGKLIFAYFTRSYSP